MIRLTIDGHTIDAPEGSTILEAARLAEIDIPTMCHLEGRPPRTSCMVCVVKVEGTRGMVPSCATAAQDGMVVDTNSAEVHRARRTNLELLLGDHTGDCLAPCQVACPAGLFIPAMLRRLADGRTSEALELTYRAFPLPAVLGAICPAPCERVCRRGQHDGAIAIARLHRFAAEKVAPGTRQQLLGVAPQSGKSTVVVGAGPCGLSAAFYLALAGHRCTIIDEHDQPGGALRYSIERDRLSLDVLELDLETIFDLDITFTGGRRLGRDVSLDELQQHYDGVVLAPGRLEEDNLPEMGLVGDLLQNVGTGVHACLTGRPGVVAWFERSRRKPMAVRAAAGGRFAAATLDAHLSGHVLGEPETFSTHIGRVTDEEMQVFLHEARPEGRLSESTDMTPGAAGTESSRCLHCDCRKPDTCKLRRLARQHGARSGRFRGDRPPFEQDRSHPEIVYEPGKCIACGICTELSQDRDEPIGLAMTGRGLRARPRGPLGHTLRKSLTGTALRCVEACPTGALALLKPSDD